MANVLFESYNLAMFQYRATLDAQQRISSQISPTAPVENNRDNYKVSDNESFSDKLSQMTNVNTTYTNGKNITYTGEVKALSSSKIQKFIKENNIDRIVTEASQKYNIPENLIYKIIETESYFNTNCVSTAGAMGLMQLMPVNCKEDGVTNPYDPYQNIMAGTKQLRRHLNSFNGDLKLALAAYNAGPGNVRKYGGVPPFKETQNYIKKILGENA